MLARKLLAHVAVGALLLSPPAQAQVIIGGAASAGSGNVGGPGSATADNFASYNGTTGKSIKDSGKSAASFAPAGAVVLVNGSNPTIAVADWAAFTQYTVIGSGRTLTVPASSGLSTNGGLAIDANAATVTLTANAADTITFNGSTGSAGGSTTLPQGGLYFLSTDGAGKLYVSGRSVQGNGAKLQLSTGSPTTNNCAKFDANGNTVDAGTTCGGGGGGGGPSPKYVSGKYYFPVNTSIGVASAPTAGQIYFTQGWVGGSFSIDALGVDVTTANASGHVQVAVYAEDATTGLPTGAPLGSTSDISTASTFAATGVLGSAIAVSQGRYWFAVMTDNTTNRFNGMNIGMTTAGFLIGTDAGGIGAPTQKYVGPTVTYGSWPTMNGTKCGTGNCVTDTGITSNNPVPTPFFRVQ